MSAPFDYRVISIGTLAAHPLWGERDDVRTGHATTTLISSGKARILVDPSLPAPALVARLEERSHLRPAQVTHVFLTSFQPLRRRALEALPQARWLVSERERETIGVSLIASLQAAREANDAELGAVLEHEIALLERCRPAPDSIAEAVDLFPLPGVTPGTCGLLLPTPRATVLVTGDAVPTAEHLIEGKVLPDAADLDQARESFAEAVEIADLLILGRDNLLINPLRQL